jgi:hypothetical protein
MDSDLDPCVLVLQHADDDGVGAGLRSKVPELEILEDGDMHSSEEANRVAFLDLGAAGKNGGSCMRAFFLASDSF